MNTSVTSFIIFCAKTFEIYCSLLCNTFWQTVIPLMCHSSQNLTLWSVLNLVARPATPHPLLLHTVSGNLHSALYFHRHCWDCHGWDLWWCFSVRGLSHPASRPLGPFTQSHCLLSKVRQHCYVNTHSHFLYSFIHWQTFNVHALITVITATETCWVIWLTASSDAQTFSILLKSKLSLFVVAYASGIVTKKPCQVQFQEVSILFSKSFMQFGSGKFGSDIKVFDTLRIHFYMMLGEGLNQCFPWISHFPNITCLKNYHSIIEQS